MKRYTLVTSSTLFLTLIGLTGCKNAPLLDPKGPVGAADLHLIIVSFILMLLVVVPVIIMALWFPRKYRSSNTKAEYDPKWSHSTKIEVVVWVIPAIIVGALSVLTWRDTHKLDPFEPISDKKPLVIDAVSFDWKWLFIYPDQKVATINDLVLPVNEPVRFDITSDSVVTSFFIPQLGSQIYAMGGKKSQLNLLANETGDYVGQNTQFSGDGFPDMHFPVKVTTQQDFEAWLQQLKQSPEKLDLAQLEKIRKPAVGYPVKAFSSVQPNLFNDILGKYRVSSNSPEKVPSNSPEKVSSKSPEKVSSNSPDKYHPQHTAAKEN